MLSTANMSADFDLDGYLARIGYDGDRAPTLDTLRALHRLHPQAIAFENLDPLAGRAVSLDVDALQRKLVHGRRGGWCFEHNHVLRHALDALGFRTTGLAARVLWNQPAGATTPRSHMLLRVELDEGAHIADVGFGGLVLTAPLRLEADTEQATPHEPFRLAADGDAYVMQARLGEAWQSLYRFDLQPQLAPDYAVTNWYLCNYPQSHFLHGVLAARTDGPRRHALRNATLTTRDGRGGAEQRTLANAAEVRDALRDLFLVEPPDDPALDAALERVLAASA